MKRFKVIVYAPIADAEKIRQVLGNAGAGRIGNYDFCSFSVRGIGRFRPLKGANPAIGQLDNLTEVEEERIEVVVEKQYLEDAIFAIREAHPYEEQAIDVIELKDLG